MLHFFIDVVIIKHDVNLLSLNRRFAAFKGMDGHILNKRFACPLADEMAKHTQNGGKLFMWYVMQVRTGTEENIRCQCQRLINSNVLERCFIPYYQQKKRFQGEWHIQERILFPGYVFLIAENPEKLVNGLRKVIGLTKLIGTGDEIVPLVQEEIDLLMKIGTDKQLVEISSGIIENDRVQILAGPLMGMEGNIRRIDRHKRMAYLEIEMFGRTVEMKVGLEIIRKE